MTTEEILREIAALPSEARRELEGFIARLIEGYKRSASTKKPDLVAEPFVGMWRDRDDMTDSSAWVRSLREKHWAN